MKSEPPREEALFQASAQLTGSSRAAFLDQACASDVALRQRLDALLAAHEAPAGVLRDEPAREVLASTIDLPEPAPDEAVGMTLGCYKLREKLGEGGCGTVYVAEQTEPVRRKVALKVIKLGMDTREVIARFEAERQALAMMDHPNIAKVLDGGTTETGRPYFVMELVRGIKITDYCDQANLTTKDRLDLFIKVCQAIQHAHQKGIIHRDIKPGNILVTLHDGVPVPKVIDFGIAKATEGRLVDATVYTQLHQFMGTPAYMSPEQAEMSGLDVDTRSDIYSLGVLLYQLLTSKTPFDGKELLSMGLDAMRKTIREKEPMRPSTRLASLQGEELTTTAKRRSADAPKLIHLLQGDLDWIVMKCLEKDRTRRYETANGLAMDLKRHLDNEPVTARPPSNIYRLQKLVRRNKVAFAAAVMVFGTLVVGLGVATWSLTRERSARAEANLRRNEAERAGIREQRERQQAEANLNLAEANLYASDMNLAFQSLKGGNLGRTKQLLERHVPTAGQPDLRHWEWRHLWQQCQGDELFILGRHPQLITSVSFSPDGKLVAAGGYKGEIKIWNVAERREVVTIPGEGSSSRVGFARGRNWFAANSRGDGVRLWDTASWKEIEPLHHDDRIRSFDFSPDGNLFAALGPDRYVAMWDLQRNSQIDPIDLKRSFVPTLHHGVVAISADSKWIAIGRDDIRIVSLSGRQERYRLQTTNGVVAALAFSPDGRLLASATGYGNSSIQLWDLDSGAALRELVGHGAWVSSLAFTPGGKTLVSGSADQTIRLWNTQSWEPDSVLRGHQNEIWSVALSPGGETLASGGKDGTVRIWSVNAPRDHSAFVLLPERVKFNGLRRGSVKSATFCENGRLLAALDEMGSVALWNVPSLKKVRQLTELGTKNSALLFSESGRWLATANQSTVIQLADPRNPVPAFSLTGHNAEAFPVRFLSDDRLLITSDGLGICKLWDLDSRREVRSWNISSNFWSIASSPDGKLMVTGTSGTVSFWDATENRHIESVEAHQQRVNNIAFSPDGRTIVTGSAQGDAKLWDVATRRVIATFEPCLTGISGVAFSPDGRRLALSSSWSQAVMLVDLTTRQQVAALEADGVMLSNLVFSPDGNALLAVDDKRQLYLWTAATEAREKTEIKQP